MKYWVQYLTQSTGYIAGSIPPAFGESSIIDAVGTDGVFILDGRNTYYTMHADALKRAQRLQHVKKFVGYQIVQGSRLFEETKRSAIVKLNYPIHV